jgi:V/A-type H+-transporting ATPase subunit I
MLHLKEDTHSAPSFIEFSDPSLTRGRDQLLARDTRLASLIANLNEGKELETSIEDTTEYDTLSIQELIDTSNEFIGRLDPELTEIERTQQIFKSRQNQLTDFEKTFFKAQELVERITQTETLDVLLVILDRRADTTLPRFEERVAELTENQFQLQFRSFDENHVAVLVMFPKEYRSTMESFLFGYRISQLWLPEDLRGLPFQELPERAQKIQERYQEQITAGEKRKNDLRIQFVHQLSILRQEILFRTTGLNLLMKSFFTETIIRIDGFIPEKFLNRFETELKARFGATITILTEAATSDAPIFRNNPPPIDVFETLTRLGGVPKYKTIDPTPFTFVLFSLFWGLMVGDIAYGIIIFLGAYYVRKRMENEAFRAIGKIFMISSLWAIFFGFLFGEFFGDLAIRANILQPIWFDRLNDILFYIEITIVMGLVIVLFGLALGVYNHIQLGERREAIANASTIVVWFFIGLALGPIIFWGNSSLLLPSLAFIFGGSGVLIWAQGPMGILELYGRFANILSYARLMAIGMISVMMTFVANEIAATINPLGGIPLAIMLHLVNMIIAVMSPSVHALRLNLYEFFTQFQQPGGTLYNPFGHTEVT